VPFENFYRCSFRGVAVAFILVGALSLVIIQVYTSLFAPARSSGLSPSAATMMASAAAPPSAVRRAVRATELSIANGEGGSPIYIAVQDPFSSRVDVFDMSSGRDFYGPGGPYHVFAGKNASCGLAKSSVSPDDVTGDLGQLSAHERDTLAQWHAKYTSKYPIVGYLIEDGAVDDGDESVMSYDKKDA
jgi:membrane-associated progesterone receptor component